MKTHERFEQCLEKEIALLEDGLSTAEEVRSRVFEHDWDGLSNSLQALNDTSKEVAETEEERNRLFQELRNELEMPEDSGFYGVIVRLPEEAREQLAERYRTLKKTVLQFQGVTWSIDAYTRTMSTTFQDILYSLYPHKRGTMYERSGKRRAVENNPLVVNKQL